MRALKSRVCRFLLPALIFGGGAWWVASTHFREDWSWPASLLFGTVFILVLAYLVRTAAGRAAPYQLVLRLADDAGGNKEDDRTFEKLYIRFKRHFSKASKIRFHGFDSDGSSIWFYFLGPDEASVRDAVLSQLDGCRIRQGSYFVSNATHLCAAPNSGPTTQLGDS